MRQGSLWALRHTMYHPKVSPQSLALQFPVHINDVGPTFYEDSLVKTSSAFGL
jgi:hypothetical protein